jgi:hypothetical protein
MKENAEIRNKLSDILFEWLKNAQTSDKLIGYILLCQPTEYTLIKGHTSSRVSFNSAQSLSNAIGKLISSRYIYTVYE